jgi:hypothetical protein
MSGEPSAAANGAAASPGAPGRSLYDELVRLRDRQRAKKDTDRVIVRLAETPVELNPLGFVRWYMHPAIEDTVHKALIFYLQDIPPRSRSGRFRTQGDCVVHIWQGRGHSLIDGARYDWEEGDIVQIPIRTPGVIVQHFNDDPNLPARLVCCEPNTTDTLTVDRGCGWEVLEPAPEARA